MTFITLTDYNHNTAIIINAETISTMHDVLENGNRSHTLVSFINNKGARVAETAEQILELIEPERKMPGMIGKLM